MQKKQAIGRRDFLRLAGWAAVGAALFPRLGKTADAVFQGSEKTRPNIIFILADDLGWRDVGCYGSTYYETPNMDRLATRGVRLTQAYAASPWCSPTRASILTGQYPARLGITAPACHLPEVQLEKKLVAARSPNTKVLEANSLTRLKPDYFTLAEALREAGYATAHFGKWHLGFNRARQGDDHYEPQDHGFASDFPHAPDAPGPGIGGFLAPWRFITDPPLAARPGEHIEDRMSAEAARYIHVHKDQPFYLNYWAYSVHSPLSARRDYIKYFKAKADEKNPQHNPVYAAMVKSLDDGVGRLLAAVDAAGIADRTIIVFFSDNGGWTKLAPQGADPAGAKIPATSNLPLKSGKAALYEGGTRVPCMVVWPGQIKPGATSEALLQSVDFYPTLLALCGLKPHADVPLDGVNQAATLLGGAAVRDRVFCHFPHGKAEQPALPGFQPGAYVRKGDWKLIRFFADNTDGSDRLELFNLRDDLGETTNLVAAQPALANELNALLTDFLRDTAAVIPVRNPTYDSLQGWRPNQCTAIAAQGRLCVTGQGPAPFLGVGVDRQTGPVTVKLRARSAGGGSGKIEGVQTRPLGAAKPQAVPFDLPGGDWHELTVALPQGRRDMLRVYLPAQQHPVEVEWIEFQTADQTRRWKF
jgi:arylsulfatase A-like enzyme